MKLAYGDTIRTAEDGLAQIDLANGLAFRLGGEAALTLQPNQELQLDSGEMLVWVEPGQKVPTEIVTPVGTAGLRGTTLFVRVPDDPGEGVVFFAWEGEIRLRFEGDTEDLILNSGEELQVRPGERLSDLRDKVRRLRRREIRQQRQQSRLVNGFSRPLPTLGQLEQTIEDAPTEP
jgi:ferric-dicitrate binding protein FerR (iron transport regulator)